MYKINTIIFSKDRALQLDATLRSFYFQCEDFYEQKIFVICKYSSDEFKKDYDIIREEFNCYNNIVFVDETSFKDDVINYTKDSDFILWIVDDNIFIKNFNLHKCCEILHQNKDSVAVSLRLGKNTVYCYPVDKFQAVPEFEEKDDLLSYRWDLAELDFNYCMEVSSSIYRTNDLFDYLKKLEYKNPNTLEEQLNLNKNQIAGDKKNLICYPESRTFCAPLNKVQADCNNRDSGNRDYSTLELSKMYKEHKRIAVDNYFTFLPYGCHQDIELKTYTVYKKKYNTSPLVSVIIPSYNQSLYIEESVQSILNQSVKDYELIIVNDGSSDDSLLKILEFYHNDAEGMIVVIDKKNNGLAAARNTGILFSKGRYIIPFDSDDRLKPFAVEKYLEYIKNFNADIFYPDYETFEAQIKYVECIDEELFYNAFRTQNGLPYCSFYIKDVWKKNCGYNTNMVWGYEDWDFWLASLKNGFKVKRIKQALFEYRIKSESMLIDALKFDKELKVQFILNNRILFEQNFESDLLSTIADNPLVTVVIPTFNRKNDLQKAIQSVLLQSFGVFEILVVNDAGEEIESVVSDFNDARIKIINHQNNKGLAAARNTGIRNSRGEFICFLDDDDELLPNYLEESLKACKKNPIIYTDAIRYSYRKDKDRTRLYKINIPYSIDFSKEKILLGNLAPVSCFFLKKRILDEIGYFDETLKVLEDWDLWIRISEKYNFNHFPIVTNRINWYEDGSTMTSSKGELFEITRELIYNKNSDRISKIKNKEKIIEEFNNIWQKDFRNNIPEISLIFLTYNGFEYTVQFLTSLINNVQSEIEIIIIDNNSQDRTPQFLLSLMDKDKHIKVILNQTNLGFPAGINQGIKYATGKYILIANNDIIVTPGSVERMMEIAKSNQDIGIVAPISNFVSGIQIDKNAKYESIVEMYNYAESIRSSNFGKFINFPRVTFLFALIKKEVFEKIGGLDERFSPGNYEDDDFCLRSQLAGYKTIIAKDVFIHHFGSKSFTADGEKKYTDLLKVNKQKFIYKWGATPDEIWYNQKMIVARNIYIPLVDNLLEQYLSRGMILLNEKDYKEALRNFEIAKSNFCEESNNENFDKNKLDEMILIVKALIDSQG